MQNEALSQFKAHAAEAYPSECCGVLVLHKGREVYVPCRNTAEGEDNFEIHPEDLADAEDRGDIVAYCHSHPNYDPRPSESDMVGVERHGLPWYVIGWPSQILTETRPSGWKAPLVGRSFYFGVLDCYSLVRDYFQETHGLEFFDYARSDKFWERGENLYLDNYAKEGFVQIEEKDLQPSDIILMNFLSPLPNHAAVFLGDSIILHHLQGRLSCREIYGGFYRKAATHFLRHRSLC